MQGGGVVAIRGLKPLARGQVNLIRRRLIVGPVVLVVVGVSVGRVLGTVVSATRVVLVVVTTSSAESTVTGGSRSISVTAVSIYLTYFRLGGLMLICPACQSLSRSG